MSLSKRSLFTIIQAAEILGVSPKTIRRLKSKGVINPQTGSNRQMLISINDLDILRNVLNKPLESKKYPVANTAKLLNVSSDTIRRWEKEGKIESVRTAGGHRRFTTEAIQQVKNKKYQPVQVKKEINIPPKEIIKIIDQRQLFTPQAPSFASLSPFLSPFNLKLISFVAVSSLLIFIATSPLKVGRVVNRLTGISIPGIPEEELITRSEGDWLSVLSAQGGIYEGDVGITGRVGITGSLDVSETTTTEDLVVEGSASMYSLSVTSGLVVSGNEIVNSSGKIPALNGTYFASLNGENIINVDAHHLGGIAASSFLRSDEVDTAEATINFTATPGSTDVNGGPVYINPAASTSNYTLFGISVDGSQRFKVDAEGDVSILGNTNATGNLTVGGTIYGDGSGISGVSASSMLFSGITSATNTTAAMIVGTGASLTYSGTGTITASDLTCVDCLDFTEISDSLTLDGATDIALGTLTLSTSGTGAIDFNSTGQVSFAGNIDVNGSTNDISGTLNLSGGALTSTGALTITPQAGNNLNIALSTTGDFAVNTNQLYVDTSEGNVGIGTTTPGSNLEIQSSSIAIIEADADAGSSYLYLHGAGGSPNSRAYVRMDDDTTNIRWYLENRTVASNQFQIQNYDGSTWTIPFTIQNSAPSNTLYLNSTGNVGIGTTAPGSKLEIARGANGPAGLAISGYDNDGTTDLNYQSLSVLQWHNDTTNLDGALVITVPNGGNTMMAIKISGYDYSVNLGYWEVQIGAYHYNGEPGNVWLNESVNIIGTPPFNIVRLARVTADDNPRIILGNTTDVDNWDYPQINVDLVISGYSSQDTYNTGWSATLSTDISALTIEHTPLIKYFVNSSGNFGIGRIPATNKLEVEGTASKTAAGDWLANSDIRIKTDVLGLDNALDIIDSLRPVKFKYIDEYMDEHPSLEDRYYYNFIAQEFQEIFPDSVQDSGENGYLQLDSYNVRPYLVAAMQELNTKVETLELGLDSGLVLGLEDNINNEPENPEGEEGTEPEEVKSTEVINELVSRVDSLETEMLLLNSSLDLASPTEATDSSFLTSLTVLGDSVLGDTVINGRLDVGILSFDNQQATIDAIGVLKIQPLALGNIEFMGGSVTMDVSGNMVVNEITAKKYKVSGNSAGSDYIESGQTSVWIETDTVGSNSLIFIATTTVTDSPLSVTEKSPDSGFRAEIEKSTDKDIHFDWWIIERE